MQVRKLIRLLTEMVDKNPRLAFKEVCIDRRYALHQCEDFTFIPIQDVETRWCVWNPEETVNEVQREVVVIGNY
jgi:hypothetical protein